MKLRRLAGYAALGLGATAAANRLLSSSRLPPALDGDQRGFRWRGIDVAYTEAGDPDDPTVVFLHGINVAGSSGEFREVFPRLAGEYHVVAPDLPGFGRSDRPPLRYSAALHEEFVRAFLDRFEAPSVVASSLTGAYVAGVLDDLDLSALVLICPTAGVAGGRREWLRELLRSPVVGEALFNLLASKPSIRYFNADHGYADPELPSEAWERYEWLTAHQRGARFAPASFVAGDLDSEVDLGATLAGADAPVTLVWGREAGIAPLPEGRELADRSGARLVVFDDARLLPHVEHGESFAETLREGL